MSDLIRQLIEKDEVTYGMLLPFYLILLSYCPTARVLPWANRPKLRPPLRVQLKKARFNYTSKASILQNIRL